jgi:hypothetical protein
MTIGLEAPDYYLRSVSTQAAMSNRDRPRVDLSSTAVDNDPPATDGGGEDLASTTKHARSYPLKSGPAISELPEQAPPPRKQAARPERRAQPRMPLPPSRSETLLKWGIGVLAVSIVVIAIALVIAVIAST